MTVVPYLPFTASSHTGHSFLLDSFSWKPQTILYWFTFDVYSYLWFTLVEYPLRQDFWILYSKAQCFDPVLFQNKYKPLIITFGSFDLNLAHVYKHLTLVLLTSIPTWLNICKSNCLFDSLFEYLCRQHIKIPFKTLDLAKPKMTFYSSSSSFLERYFHSTSN